MQGHTRSSQTWNVQKFLIVNVGCSKPLGLWQFAAQRAWSGGSRSQGQETDSRGVYYNITCKWFFISPGVQGCVCWSPAWAVLPLLPTRAHFPLCCCSWVSS